MKVVEVAKAEAEAIMKG
jgi:dynein intermediate chain